MDTREKIVPVRDLGARLAHGDWLALVGWFDPLTATLAKQVAESTAPGRNLLAVVLDADDTLLPAEARAALMAALRAVDVVTMAKPHEWRAMAASSARIEIVEDSEGERRRSAEFVELVLKRDAS
ncbi:MAG TPA: hypothetical protein VGL97_11990 [Bryobacteraceae bacterium]